MNDNAGDTCFVVIPARNERATIGDVVEEFRTVRIGAPTPASPTVLVVDDGSNDDTAALANEAGGIVIPNALGHGLAPAFNTGVRAALNAGATHIVHTDADGQYSAEALPEMYARCRSGADLVLGNRLWRRPEGISDFRYLWNARLTGLVNLIAGSSCSDTQTGYRVFTRSVAEAFTITSRFTYTQEQVIRTAKARFVIDEVPIVFGPRRAGSSRLVDSPLGYLHKVLGDLENVAREYRVDLEMLEFLEPSRSEA